MDKTRYIALTDINPKHLPWTEKDDIQSLIRLLLYSNEIDIEGVILCSSCFLKKSGGKGALKIVNKLVDAYGEVKPNLDIHAHGYPEANELRRRVHMGIPAFGRSQGNGFAEEKYSDNDGVRCIIDALRSPDPRPLWIGIWSGANTLAQALWQIRKDCSPEEEAKLISKLRIHSISDQDMSGEWIRRNFPSLFYIVTPSNGTIRGTEEYCKAVWPGISADRNQHGSEDGISGGGFSGADTAFIEEKWLDEHIRKGPLGSLYPKTVFIAEGDTPAFLGLIPNGLNDPEHPEYGGWSGRYQNVVSPEGSRIFSGAVDSVNGIDGKMHKSPQASLWRWRRDFQLDFAVRINWSVNGIYENCSHAPIIATDISQKDGIITIDASRCSSPDGESVRYCWMWYPEAGTASEFPRIDENADKISFSPNKPGTYHLILKVSGSREDGICSYKRFIFKSN
ncbi:MAG TPA: hypothetical protein DEQ52_02165 [Ruminococcaceae bacterium]|nr:hypothetical protein [Oscillospiraceae bacterium]